MGSLKLDSDDPSRESGSASSGDQDEAQAREKANGDEEEGEEDGEEIEPPVYLKWDDENGLDGEKYAVLPNDWPYNVPYGVRHFCVWSRVSELSNTHQSKRRLTPHLVI